MQPKRRRPTLPLVCLLAAAVLAGGCKRPAPPATVPARPHQGTVLRVACPADTPADIVKLYGGAWAEREGAKLEVLRYRPGDYPPNEADIWVIRPAELGRWAAAERLHPVPDSLRAERGSYGWKGLLPIYRNTLLVWGGRSYAVPLVGEGPLCFYRADLFASRPLQDAFAKRYARKLAPPNTWEEFAEAAEFFAEQEDAPKPPLPPLPERDEDLDRLFGSVAAPFVCQAVNPGDPKPPPDVEMFSFHYDRHTGQVRIDTPGFVHALELLQRLQALRPPGTHPAPPEAFADGRAVLCLADVSWIERFQNGAVKGKFGICRVPGAGCCFAYPTGEKKSAPTTGNRMPYLGAGGWLAAVPARSSHSEAAFALLAALSGRDASRQIVHEPKWGSGPYRGEHLDDQSGWYGFGLEKVPTRELTDALSQTLLHPDLRRAQFRLRTPDEREHLKALAAEVRRALLEKRDAAEALAAAADRWRELDGSKDLKTRLAEYRFSLGLQVE